MPSLTRTADRVRAAAAAAAAVALCAFSLFGDDDPQQWLEDPASERTQSWVRAENEKTLSALLNDPLYEPLTRTLSAQRTPLPELTLEGGSLWEVRREGKVVADWRRASLASAKRGAPDWTTLAAFDPPAPPHVRFETRCLPPTASRCLVRAGADPEWREFDVAQRRFVGEDTFALSGYDAVVWEAADAVVGLAVDATGASVVRRIRRGADAAQAETLAAAAERLAVARLPGPQGGARLIRAADPAGGFVPLFVPQGRAPAPLPLPAALTPKGVVGAALVVEVRAAWSANGANHAAGAILALPLAAALKGDLGGLVSVYAPDPAQIVLRSEVAADGIAIAVRRNGTGHVLRATPQRRGWRVTPVAVPEGDSAELVSADPAGGLLLRIDSWLRPDRLQVHPESGAAIAIAARGEGLPGFEQLALTATAADGVAVPYVLLRPVGALNDGSAPALVLVRDLDGRLSPDARAAAVAWARKGRAFAIAFPRGDAALGPAWAAAGRGPANLPVAASDLGAALRDLAARGIADPRRIGLWAAGEGALVAAMALAQSPDAARAAVLQQPLLDVSNFVRLGGDPARLPIVGDGADAADAALIGAWSPYRTLPKTDGTPALLMIASDAAAAHARKTAAALHAAGRTALYFEPPPAGAADAGALGLVFLDRALAR